MCTLSNHRALPQDENGACVSDENEYRPEKPPVGFFPPVETAHKLVTGDETVPPVKAGCYVPNSVLVRLLWPVEKLETTAPYRPPQITEEQVKQITARNKRVIHSSPFDLLWLFWDFVLMPRADFRSTICKQKSIVSCSNLQFGTGFSSWTLTVIRKMKRRKRKSPKKMWRTKCSKCWPGCPHYR